MAHCLRKQCADRSGTVNRNIGISGFSCIEIKNRIHALPVVEQFKMQMAVHKVVRSRRANHITDCDGRTDRNINRSEIGVSDFVTMGICKIHIIPVTVVIPRFAYRPVKAGQHLRICKRININAIVILGIAGERVYPVAVIACHSVEPVEINGFPEHLKIPPDLVIVIEVQLLFIRKPFLTELFEVPVCQRHIECVYMAHSRNFNFRPVIIRKILTQLKNAGLITVARGTGGIELMRDLSEITFYDVYEAIGAVENGDLFHFHESPNPECPVGRNIHVLLDEKLKAIQDAMENELRKYTLLDLRSGMNELLAKEN